MTFNKIRRALLALCVGAAALGVAHAQGSEGLSGPVRLAVGFPAGGAVDIVARVVEMADKYGKTPAQVSLAWLLGKPGVVAPVVGVSRLEQLDQLVAATQFTLEPTDVAYLEALYRPVDNLLSIGTS